MKRKLSTKMKFNLIKKFEKQWVAFNKDRTEVVASGKTMEEVDAKLRTAKKIASVISYIMPFDRHFAPYVQT